MKIISRKACRWETIAEITDEMGRVWVFMFLEDEEGMEEESLMVQENGEWSDDVDEVPEAVIEKLRGAL